MPPVSTPAPEFGLKAPDFKLRGTDGRTYAFDDVAGPRGTLVMFICNHCPYVKAIAERLAEDTRALMEMGVGVIGIMPNDVTKYPEDSFENMQEFARQHQFPFPYVIDETQEVARAFGAVCTPDFFGYNAKRELQFRGRLDETNPSRPSTPGTRRELLEAMTMIAETGRGPDGQVPSMGCGIKWKAAA